jgi:hypothetical protein
LFAKPRNPPSSPFSKGEKEESPSEGLPKSIPPFEKGRTGEFAGPLFQKVKMIPL